MFQNKKRILCLLLALLFAAEGPFFLNRQAEVSAAEVVLPTVLPGAIWSLLGAAGVAAGLGIADSIPDSDYAAAAEKLKSLITDMNEQGCLPSSLSSLVTVAADAGAATGDLTNAFCNYMKEEGLILENKDLEKKYSEYEKEPDKNKNEDKKKKVIGVGGDVLKKIAEALLEGFTSFGKKLQEEDSDTLNLGVWPFSVSNPYSSYNAYVILSAEIENTVEYFAVFYSGDGTVRLNSYHPALDGIYYNTSAFICNGAWQILRFVSGQWISDISPITGQSPSWGGFWIKNHYSYFKVLYNSRVVTMYNHATRETASLAINPYALWEGKEFPVDSPAVCIQNYITKNYENITYSNDVYDYSTGNTVNNFYTDNSYLLPADPADVVRDIVAPATTVVNNNNTTINNETVGQIGDIFHHNTTNTTNNMKMTDVINYNELIADGTFNEYTYDGLDKYFPFSIPSDIILFLNVLSAEPRAPEFDFILPLSVVGLKDYKIHIDLSSFDKLAKILREAELFSGCVGLVFLTRKLIK